MKTIEIEVKFVKEKYGKSDVYTYKPVFDEAFEGTNIKLRSGVAIYFRNNEYFTVKEESVGGKVIMWLAQGKDAGEPPLVQEMFETLGVKNTNADVITVIFKGKTCLL